MIHTLRVLRWRVAFQEQKPTARTLNQFFFFLCVGALAERGGKGLHTLLLLLNKEGKTSPPALHMYVLILCNTIIQKVLVLINRRFLQSSEQVVGLGKSSFRRPTRFQVISSNQILARALTNTPKVIARTYLSCCLATSAPNTAGSVNSHFDDVALQ